MTQGLTIGELANFVGVTVRTVRHYHHRGLLPEPQRDASGYRRYDASQVVDLIRITTLAGAGVPLARIGELLAADETRFDAGTREIDAKLQAQIKQLQRHRTQVAALASGDALVLPPEVTSFLQRLRCLGASERFIAVERDGWILLAARAPAQAAAWMQQKTASLDDSEIGPLYLRFVQAEDWPADDPRLEVLAGEFADFLELQERKDLLATDAEDVGADVLQLLDAHAMQASPVFRRLSALLAERGWVGWTNFRRAAATPTGN